jgi:hypothetical protein
MIVAALRKYEQENPPGKAVECYGWMPHNASFGFLDRPRGVLGQIHFLDRF